MDSRQLREFTTNQLWNIILKNPGSAAAALNLRQAAESTNRMPLVHVLTNIPSYHQVDLFDEVATRFDVRLFVTYLRPRTPGRGWTDLPKPNHDHVFAPCALNRLGALYINPGFVRNFIRRNDDLVVIGQYAGMSLQLAMYICRLKRTPWVFWAERAGVQHYEVSSGLPSPLLPLARRLALAPVARWPVSVWGTGARAAEAYSSLTRTSCRSMPYVSRLSRFHRPSDYRREGDPLRFLFLGNLSFRKGFDLVCKAWPVVAADARSAGASLTVCGTGGMLAEAESLRAACSSVDLVGFKQLDEVPSVLWKADVLICPSRYDGWGMVVPEAAAAGLSVIASDQVQSAVDFGTRPWLDLIPSGDAAALASAMLRFASTKEEVLGRSESARRDSILYDVSSGAQIFANLCREALETARLSL